MIKKYTFMHLVDAFKWLTAKHSGKQYIWPECLFPGNPSHVLV